ncbi:hypothetical protein [Cupriavidus pinatubonensis]|uniref:Peptidase M23B n=1 Tax=Cupriavidus pinatubonensis TaxID=248026 RepID=A0ABN7ZAS3_9BURK|nr:hypothetical protein [Cupriavidus pinatubonensis]CAG9183047.1 hypothetical protein LMG23994_05051 [Cupriavidus pinatubonensis]
MMLLPARHAPCGNTGNAQGTPPHLHYGIYTAGGAINPCPLLAVPIRTPAGTGKQARQP